MNKEQEYEKLASEVTDELNSIDNMLQDAVKRCIEISTSEVTASITFKIPAFIIPDNIQELRGKLLRLKQLSKDFGLDYLQNDEIDSAIKSLDNLKASYYKEYDNYNDIDDLRCGLDMDVEIEPPILSSNEGG